MRAFRVRVRIKGVISLDGERDRRRRAHMAETARQIRGAVRHAARHEHLHGFALVTWNEKMSGICSWRLGGLIHQEALPSYVAHRLTEEISIDGALYKLGAFDPDEPA